MNKTAIQALLAVTAAWAAAAAGAAAQAPREAEFPTKPVRMIVPFTPGSATDIIARIVATKLSEKWGRQIVIDNRPGAGGIVAFKMVAEAVPDGYTLTTTGSNFSGSAALYAGKLPYDPVKDFAGISQLASTPLILVVAPNLGVKSVKDLIALVKAKPGAINYGSTGLGSGPHYGAELFNLTAGIKAVHVPYKGTPEVLNDITAGRMHYFLSPVLAAAPLVQGGRLIALGVTTKQRSPSLPEVPSISEVGLPEFEYQGWYGMFAPGKASRSLINFLNREVAGVIDLPEIQQRIVGLGAAAKRSTPEEFDKLAREEITTRTKVWAAAGVKVD
jgi:tripartite-type tricarboxylate transporter receptor subunit TctC